MRTLSRRSGGPGRFSTSRAIPCAIAFVVLATAPNYAYSQSQASQATLHVKETFNVPLGDASGVRFAVKATVTNAYDRDFGVGVWFYDQFDRPLKTDNKKFADVDGNTSLWRVVHSSYDTVEIKAVLSIKYDDLGKEGYFGIYRYEVQIYDLSTDNYIGNYHRGTVFVDWPPVDPAQKRRVLANEDVILGVAKRPASLQNAGDADLRHYLKRRDEQDRSIKDDNDRKYLQRRIIQDDINRKYIDMQVNHNYVIQQDIQRHIIQTYNNRR